MASRILFFLALLSLLAAEEAVMLGRKLNSPGRLFCNYSDPCKWKNSDNRVVRIQIGRLNLGGFLSSNINDGSDGSPIVAILGSFVVVFCAVIGVLVFFLCRAAKVEPWSHVTIADSNLDGEGLEGFSVQVLTNARNILGSGEFGSIYKGELNDGTKVVVKKMKRGMMSDKGFDELESEISARTKVRHINLVKLLGYCIKGNQRLLVFELMTQGTLSRFLFNWNEEGLKPLEWRKRLGIALDVARGVEHLHCFAEQSFIIRDLKPSNILLGDDMRAKVADFGVFRNAPLDWEALAASKFVGTFGYLAPEYAETGKVSTKMDVYSFGVVLMELITGRKALDKSLPEEKQHLVAWFRDMLISKGTDAFSKAIDPNLDLSEQETLSSIITVAELAGYCSSREPNQRPCMSHVVNVLWYLVEFGSQPNLLIHKLAMESNHCMTLAQMIKTWKVVEGKE